MVGVEVPVAVRVAASMAEGLWLRVRVAVREEDRVKGALREALEVAVQAS